MAKSNLYAGVAGYVGRADQVGKVGVFSRAAGAETWSQPISEHECYAVHVHPTDPKVVFAGTKDGVYRSTDSGKTFQRANFRLITRSLCLEAVPTGPPTFSPVARRAIAKRTQKPSGSF